MCSSSMNITDFKSAMQCHMRTHTDMYKHVCKYNHIFQAVHSHNIHTCKNTCSTTQSCTWTCINAHTCSSTQSGTKIVIYIDMYKHECKHAHEFWGAWGLQHISFERTCIHPFERTCIHPAHFIRTYMYTSIRTYMYTSLGLKHTITYESVIFFCRLDVFQFTGTHMYIQA